MTFPHIPDIQGLRVHRTLKAGLAEGASYAQSGAVTETVPIAGTARIRVRFKASRSGTLSAAFIRPDGTTAYEQNNPSNVAVTGGTETKMDIDPCFGESRLKLTFTEGGVGAGTITFCDVMFGY